MARAAVRPLGPNSLHPPDVACGVTRHYQRMCAWVLVSDSDTGEGIAVRCAGLRDRLVARFRAGRLDQELARGVAPDTSAPLVLRAQRLIAPSTRAALAGEIQRILREATSGYVWVISRVAPRRREVLDAAEELDALARRLVEAAPVSAGGVARVRLLLTDGCGPLYFPGAGDRLRTLVSAALEGLEQP
jgi:hypothetical protein